MNFLKRYNINIKNKEYYETALTHSSYSNEHKVKDYERLEFLGDAVLQLVVSDYLFNTTDNLEGEMSKIRASYVCEAALATYAKEVGIIEEIRLGNGQSRALNDTIIADVFEAVLGAIYLDLGFEVAKSYVGTIVIPHIESKDEYFGDYKSLLQELVQTDRKSLEYVLLSESGPAHDKWFEMAVQIDQMVYGIGTGKSKKEAEQNAAKAAYEKRAK